MTVAFWAYGAMAAARMDARLRVPVTRTAPVPVPYDDKREYISSKGAQWIDTGVRFQQGYKLEISFYPTTKLAAFGSTTAFVCGSGNVWDNGIGINWDSSAVGSGGSIRVNMGTRDNVTSGVMPQLSTKYKVTVQGTQATINSTTYTPSQGTDYPNTLLIFTQRLNGSTGTPDYTWMSSYCRLYYIKIWDANGTLLFDGIPVTKGGKGMVYDSVSNGLFRNLGTGDFGYGNIVR